MGLQGVVIGISGHLMPVQPPDIFPPAQYLTDKALNCAERSGAIIISAFGPAADIKRVKQAEIECRRNQTVMQEGLARQHGILGRAEIGQPVGYKVIKGLLGLIGRHRPSKACRLADVIAKAVFNQTKHLLSDGIG